MFHYTNSIVNKQGDVLPGYFVQVVNPATGLVVPIYSDKGGTPITTVSGVANMALVDANGMVSFYVVDGNYNVNLYAQDATTLKGSYLDVPMVGAITLQIGTVSMLSAGAAPTASIDSSTTPAKLNLGLPTTTGAQGNPGIQGPGGNANGVSQVASLTALKAVTGQATGEPRYVTAPGLEGTFVYKLGDYSARVTADTRGGIFAAASGIATTVGAWVRQFDGFANVRWWGTAGDDSTDDLPAFNGALATLKAMTNNTTANANGVSAPGLYLPTPTKGYYLSGTLNIFHQVHIKGDGAGQIGSILRFAPNVNGIVFNEYRTNNDAGNASTATGLGDASHSVLEGVCIFGGGSQGVLGPYTRAGNTTGWGIRIRTNPICLRRVYVAFFGSGGYSIEATAGASGRTAGNANQFLLEQCEAWYNIGPGFYIQGSDVNAGKVTNCNATSNGGGGFLEYSFLGNTYDACHTRDNGYNDPNAQGNPVGSCTYGGNQYYVLQGQEAAASTTTPGTNSAVWVLSTTGISAGPTWTSGKTWVCGACYATQASNANQRNVFTGCYAESAQIPAMIYAPSLWQGGLTDASAGFDSTSTASILSASTINGGGLKSTSGFAVASGSNVIQYGQAGNTLQVLYHQIGSNNYRIFANGTVIQKQDQNSGFNEQWGLSTDASNLGPYHHYIQRLFVGNASQPANFSSQLGYTNLLSDLNGKYVTQGSRFYYGNATSGQREGLYVTTAGTVGSGAVLVEFGKIGPNVGYITGDGGAVTQATSKATGVTLNKLCGQITLNNASLAANTAVSFVLTNSNIAATDVMRVNVASGAATPGSYLVQAEAFGAGSVTISVRNMTAGALGEALVLNFVVIKSVAA